MNLKKTIMSAHSTATKNRVVNYVNGGQRRFDELMELFLKGDYRLTQRAAWPVGEIGAKHPALVKKHIAGMINKLRGQDLHDAVPRNVMRVFQYLKIPEKYCAQALDLCYGYIKNESVAVAIRANAITVALNINLRFPELIPEFLLLLNEVRSVPQTAAMNVRIKRAMILLQA